MNFMKSKPVILSIAGSDPSGGAGIQADIKTVLNFNAYPCSVISALTAQNTMGIDGIWPVDNQILELQLSSVLSDFTPDAIKIGLIRSVDSIMIIGKVLKDFQILNNIVIDPILSLTLSDETLRDDLIMALVSELFPLATLVVPNIPEFNKIEETTGKPFIDLCSAWLLKGGHNEDDESEVVDSLFYRSYSDQTDNLPSTTFPTLNFNHSGFFNHHNYLPSFGEDFIMVQKDFTHKRINTSNSHGSGCLLSTAVACGLAKGESLQESVRHAVKYVDNALSHSVNYKISKGNYGPSLI